jgi:hypothetical protein
LPVQVAARPAAIFLILTLALAGCAHGPYPPDARPADQRGGAYLSTVAEPLLVAHLMAFALSDDDGGRATAVDAAHVRRLVGYANDIYRRAGIRFEFSPEAGDFQQLRDTRLNDLDVNGDWARAERRGNEVAARFPDRLVVFFRHGPGPDSTHVGFASWEYDFVVMPGESWSCGHEAVAHLAHELGHHLGLAHTYAHPLMDRRQAEAYMRQKQTQDPAIFDGDHLADTPPDPAIADFVCMDLDEVHLEGVTLPLARRNLMSTYEEADSLTPEQVARARWFLARRLAHKMKLSSNDAGRRRGEGVFEAEHLNFSARENCPPVVQEMGLFGAGVFRGGAQVFCLSPQHRPVAFTMTLPVEQAGRYRVELYLTHAPDYGILELAIDGAPLGAPYDAWAPWVSPSGAVTFGERTLSAGKHELLFRARNKNAASTSYGIGVDAIALTPAPRADAR